MQERTGNIFNCMETFDAICITTNGTVKKNGQAVMGRGVALAAAQKWPDLPAILGRWLKNKGNIVGNLASIKYLNGRECAIVSFPVKHNWWEKADINLIKSSCHDLVTLTSRMGWSKVALVRLGCGNGQLKWDEVQLEIAPILNNTFYIFTV